jgi:hypothetical protein
MKTLEIKMKLDKKLNPKLAHTYQLSKNLIRLQTSDGYLITIINSKDDAVIHHGSKDTIFLDFEGNLLNHFLTKSKILVSDNYDVNSYNKVFLEILKALSVKTKKEAIKQLDNVPFFEIKNLLIKTFNIDYKLENIYDVFGDDEYRPAFYKDVKAKNIINKKVRIEDKSCYLFNDEFVDMLSGMRHHTKTKVYPEVSVKYKEVSKDDKYHDVSCGPNAKVYRYLQKVKITKDELKGKEFIKIRNLKNEVFTFINTPNGYALKDDKGNVFKISHPDLRIYVLE